MWQIATLPVLESQPGPRLPILASQFHQGGGGELAERRTTNLWEAISGRPVMVSLSLSPPLSTPADYLAQGNETKPASELGDVDAALLSPQIDKYTMLIGPT